MSWTDTHARALAAAFAALDEEGIDWLVLRNHEGLPKFNRSKDVDLGLDKADFRRAEKAISRTLMGVGFDRVFVDDYQYVRCLTFINVSGSVPVSIKIDLLDGFVFRGAQIFHFRDLLSHARREENFVIPSAIDDAVMLWIKPLLTGGIVKPNYVADIERAARNDPASFRAVLERIMSRKWADLAWSKIAAGDIHGTIKMKPALRRSAWGRALRRSPLVTLRNTGHHIFSEIMRRCRRPSPALLCVVGPDGVGKSTFIEHLASGLAELQVKDPDAILVQHFRPHILPNLNELLTGKPEVISEFNNPHSAAPASFPSSLVRVTYYWIDYVLGYWMKLRSRLLRGRTIIFDRYFYDIIVDPRRSRLSLPGWISRLYLAVTPKPDLVFFLDADADVIYARKQELPPEEIARQLQAYRELARRYPTRFVRLDARQQPETIVREAMRALVERAYRRINE